MRVGANAVFGDITTYKTLGADSAMTHSPFLGELRFLGKIL